MFKKIAAFAILMWYLVSLVGLDIHRDIEHGHIYVVPAWMAQSCETIHPHVHCHDCDGCHEGEECCHTDGCEEDEDCCTDDFESVTITGTDSDSQSVKHFLTQTALTVLVPNSIGSALPRFTKRVIAKGPPQVPLDISVRNCVIRA